jgi:hypothetical protein
VNFSSYSTHDMFGKSLLAALPARLKTMSTLDDHG